MKINTISRNKIQVGDKRAFTQDGLEKFREKKNNNKKISNLNFSLSVEQNFKQWQRNIIKQSTSQVIKQNKILLWTYQD